MLAKDRELFAKDREVFAEQQAKERKAYINALNNVISMGESHRSSSENKIGLLFELTMEQKLQSIVSRDFPHLVLHEIPTRRLYTEKDPHFATACSLGEVQCTFCNDNTNGDYYCS